MVMITMMMLITMMTMMNMTMMMTDLVAIASLGLAFHLVDCQVVQAVLVVVPHDSTVVDAAVSAVCLAAVLRETVIMKTCRGGGEEVPLLVLAQGHSDVKLGLVMVGSFIIKANALELSPRLTSLHH